MQIISNDALSILKNSNPRNFEIQVDLLTPAMVNKEMVSTLTFSNKHIIAGSISIDSNSVSSENLEIGCADTTEFIFTLDNYDKIFSEVKFEGSTVTVFEFIGIEQIKLGTFVVDEPPKRLNKISIKALDKMARFNRKYESNFSIPRTLLEIIVESCSKCGVSIGTTISNGFTNSGHEAIPPVGEDTTFHQVVSWVAELAGANAWVDVDGVLQMSWYGENQSITSFGISPSDRFTYEVSESDVTITGLIFKEEKLEEYLIGTDEYAIVIENNPLLKRDSTDFETVVSNLNSKIVGFSYRPFSIETLGFPHLQPMDKISIIDSNSLGIISYITNHNYRLNGKSKLSAKGKTNTIKGYATFGQFTPAQKRIIQTLSNENIEQEISTFESQILNFNELMTNSLGYFETIVTDSITGAKTRYIHDGVNITDSTNIYMQSSDGFAYANSGWSTYPDGVPNGGWISGMTADGNIIGKILSVVGLNAEWINAGTIDANKITVAGTGKDLETTVSQLTSDYLSLTNDVGNLKTGGGNLVKNATLGTTDEPAGDWWSTGITWGEVKILGLTWGNAKTKTWGQAKSGEL